MFDGNEYGVPAEMLDDCDFYVIDIAGVKTLRENYHAPQLVVIYLDVPSDRAAARMRSRGDSPEKIQQRLENDKKMFSNVEGLKPDYIIDASRGIVDVVTDVMAIVRKS